MEDERTKEEVAEQARQLARRTMAQPAQKQEWPKKKRATKSRAGASKPKKRAPTGATS
jgi:hypothetical protein